MFDAIYKNPFFTNQTLLYDVIRDNHKVTQVRILKGTGSISVWPESRNIIKVGDILSMDGDKLVVTTIAAKSSDTEQFKVQTKYEFEREYGTHIDHISQSQIAVGSNGISQSQENNVTLKTIKDNAFDVSSKDQEIFHELVDQLEQLNDGKISVTKSSFSKFGKLLKEYGPLGLQVGEFLRKIITGV